MRGTNSEFTKNPKIELHIEGDEEIGYNVYSIGDELKMGLFGEGCTVAEAMEDYFYNIGELFDSGDIESMRIEIVRD